MHALHLKILIQGIALTGRFSTGIYVYSEELKTAAPRDARCIIMNDKSKYIYSYSIDKMGYIFRDDHLPIKWVDGMVRHAKVRYMYSDSEKMNNNPELKKYIDHVIMTKGSITVFKLKVPD